MTIAERASCCTRANTTPGRRPTCGCGSVCAAREEAAAEIARLRAELEEAQRERKALLDAARNWWEGYRPLRWSEEEHIAQPRVNLMTTRDGELATLVAAIAAQGAKE